jgi:hypothetical protein
MKFKGLAEIAMHLVNKGLTVILTTMIDFFSSVSGLNIQAFLD